MANKLYDENSVKAIADAIRAKNGSTEKYKLADMPLAIENIESSAEGKCWDYVASFKISEYVDLDIADVEIPKYCQSLYRSFSGTYAVRPKYKMVIVSKPDETEYPITDLREMFYYNTTTRELYLNIDTSKVTNFSNILQLNYTGLNHIYGEIDCSSSGQSINGFNGNNLVTITFKAETIKSSIAFSAASKLSDESIQSIINGLAQVETAQTITFHANVKAKLTEEQIAVINEKGWTLA